MADRNAVLAALKDPSTRERHSQAVRRALGGGPLGGAIADQLMGTGNVVVGWADAVPFYGSYLGADEDARTAAKPGLENKAGGGLGLALGALPIAGPVGKRLSKRSAKAAGEGIDDVARAVVKAKGAKPNPSPVTVEQIQAALAPKPQAAAPAPGPQPTSPKPSAPAPAPKATVSLTAEQVPYGDSGYDIAQRSPAERQAYTDAAPWTDPSGRDRISQALGYEALPTQQGQGYWQPPSGPPEINPVEVHRPQVGLNAAGEVPPADAAAFNFAQAYRGLNDVQAGTPWHALGGPAQAPADRYSLDLGRQPTSDEMARFSGAMGLVDGGVWNASNGVTFARGFDDAAPQIDAAVQGVAPQAVARQNAGGDYIDLSGELGNPGQGQATEKVLAYQAELAPDQLARVGDPAGPFQQASQEAGALRAERARQFGVEGVRPDFDLLWKLQAEGGWNRVQQWIRENGPAGLPVLAGWVALHDQQGQTPAQQ